jgi:ribosomal-protein-serine acetyltransferase
MFSYKLSENAEVRLLEERHAQELTDLTERNREHLRAWLPWVDTNRTVEDRKNFIRGALKQFAHNKGFVAGIWHEGRLAGVIGYQPIDWENRTTALGYWLGEEFQGQGLIACATENKRSCAIPERLGFRREGVQRQAEWLYDHYVDHVVYATLASEWQTQRS